jgi:hypothetical protein
MTNTAYYNIDLAEGFLTTDGAEPSAIRIGIIDHRGEVIEVVTLETLARTGDQHQLYMSNYGHVGDVVYELWTPGTDTLLKKLGHLRSLQATGMVAPGKQNCSSNIYNLSLERDAREQGRQ